jgi:hypothetical protein
MGARRDGHPHVEAEHFRDCAIRLASARRTQSGTRAALSLPGRVPGRPTQPLRFGPKARLRVGRPAPLPPITEAGRSIARARSVPASRRVEAAASLRQDPSRLQAARVASCRLSPASCRRAESHAPHPCSRGPTDGLADAAEVPELHALDLVDVRDGADPGHGPH